MKNHCSQEGKASMQSRERLAGKTKGTLRSRPLFRFFDSVKSSYFFFALFFFAFFLVAMCSILPFHFSWMRSKKKTAIDDCIELLKFEVKKKIDVTFDGTPCKVQKFSLGLPHIIPLLEKKNNAIPENAS
jgi:hypothetical protein